jgi:hypothetical protein
MRTAVLTAALALACAALPVPSAEPPASPAPSPPAPPAKTVYLYGDASLDALRTSDPRHYELVRAILADAAELCRPEATGQFLSTIDGSTIKGSTVNGPALCARGLFKTSYPPKWQLAFRLDDVQYIALVTVKGFQPRLLPAR